jgi:spore germination cell wall hydrolase CwlJ-like protein
MGLALIRRLVLPALLVGAAGAQAGEHKAALQDAELRCLALNIYHEARGEPFEGKLAVGHVVLNRVADRRFPRGICTVIRQGGESRLHRCHFSWWCDGRSDRPRETAAWRESVMVAQLIHAGLTRDPTDGALWYHAGYVSPGWAEKVVRRAKIGGHIFYIADEETRRKAGAGPARATVPAYGRPDA